MPLSSPPIFSSDSFSFHSALFESILLRFSACLDKVRGFLEKKTTMSGMERLPGDKARSCIDLIDSLRFLGLEQDLALPAIAVIGDVGAGKSSVLEALSGVALPRRRNYPLVLKMKKTKVGDEWYGIVKYQKCEKIVNEKKIHKPTDVDKTFAQVKPWNYSMTSDGFLCLEIESPHVPDLTLIDLPSIPTEQLKEAQEKIKSPLKKFITKQKIFTLVIIPCNEDIATTEALKMAQEVDPNGKRTLGILTKPDLIDKDKEKIIIDIVQNKVIPLKKGYMIVRCREQEKESLFDETKKEKAFFKNHTLLMKLYEADYTTVPTLAKKLTLELKNHIEKFIPQLKEQVKSELLQTNTELKRYGNAPPSNEADRLTFLTDKVTAFTVDTTSFITGELLELVDQKIFSVWRDIVENTEQSFCLKLEEEVTQYEHKYPERMMSGFINYNTFENLIKNQIKLLEEPAVMTLNDVAEMVSKELQKLVENSFGGLSKLITNTQTKISDVILVRKKASESMLRMQFKMELFVHTGDSMCSKKTGQHKEEMCAISTANISGTCAILTNMMKQLKSYYQITCQRLASQIPLMIRFQMLQEMPSQLQKDMLQMLKNRPDTSVLLTEDSSMNQNRAKIQSRFKSLTKARILLSEF